MKLYRIPLLAILLSVLFAASAHAELAEDVARDLKTQRGIVIMPTGGEFLVDLDAAQGLRTGDLLSVVKPGEKIIHPTTKAVLGTTEELKGILQVTRVLSGYSYARPVSVQGEIGRGDAVRRFGSMGAFFIDRTGEGRAFYEQLRLALPALEWEPYSEGAGGAQTVSGSPLTFVLSEGRLEVRGPNAEELYRYPTGSGASIAVAPQSPAAPPAGSIAVVPRSESAPAGAIVQRKRDETAGLSFPADFEGTVVGVEVGDFDGDGRNEVAVALPRRLEVGRIVNGTYARLQVIELGIGRKVLGLERADLAGDGRTQLFLTAARDSDLSSLVVGHLNGRYQVVQEDIPWYFRAVQLPAEGDVLLAQRMGGLEADFSGPIFRVKREGGKVVEGGEIPVPGNASVLGFLPFQGSEGETLFLQFTGWDHLKVVRPGGEVLWESEEPYGGSEAYIERRDPTKNPADGPAVRSAYMQARIRLAPGGEILIPFNQGWRTISGVRNFKKSRLVAMTWNGFSLQELWHTLDQSAYLADFAVADVDGDGAEEIVQALVFSKEGFRSKGRSALGVFQLP